MLLLRVKRDFQSDFVLPWRLPTEPESEKRLTVGLCFVKRTTNQACEWVETYGCTLFCQKDYQSSLWVRRDLRSDLFYFLFIILMTNWTCQWKRQTDSTVASEIAACSKKKVSIEKKKFSASALEANLTSCPRRVSGELDISQSSMVCQIHNLSKSFWSWWIVPHVLTKYCKTFDSLHMKMFHSNLRQPLVSGTFFLSPKKS